jgi:hypothetical protein
MAMYVLHHRHERGDCGVAVAAWRGFRSALRGGSVLSSCHEDGHELWFIVEAADQRAALALLPPWIGARTRPTRVDERAIP